MGGVKLPILLDDVASATKEEDWKPTSSISRSSA